MTRRVRGAGLVLAIAVAIGSLPSLGFAAQTDPPPQSGAQGPPPPRGQGPRAGGPRVGQPPGARGPNAPGVNAEQAEMLFDRAMLNQARKALNLDVAQFQAFRPRLAQLQMVRRRAQRMRQMLIRDLNDLTTGPGAADTAAVQAKLKALDAADAAALEQIRVARAGIEDVLTPSQQARFRVFEQRMERQKLDLIQRARQQAAGAPATP